MKDMDLIKLNRWLKSKRSITKAFLQPRQTIELGPAWAGNSVNCVPYRIDAVRTQNGTRHLAYFDDEGDIVVARVDVSGGPLVRAHIKNSRKPFDAHQAISLGIDHLGCIHLAFGAHTSTLLVTRSRSRYIEDGFVEVTEDSGNATYPMFLNLGDKGLVRLHRRGRHSEGEIFVDRFKPEDFGWTRDPTPLISGLGQLSPSGPYLNTPVVAPSGSVHLFIVWRLSNTATSAGEVVNVGLDSLVSNDGLRSLFTHRGVECFLPVTPITSERVIAVPLGASLINQGSAALLPTGQPAALTYWDTGDGVPQYKLCWLEDFSWRTSTVSCFKTSFRLDGGGTLPLPHSRPELLVRDDGRMIILYRSSEANNALVASQLYPPYYDINHASQQILINEDLGFYEPVVDRTAWSERGELVLYIQRCAQRFGRDGQKDLESSSAQLMSWTAI